MITLKYKLISRTITDAEPFYILTEIINGEADKIRFELPSKNALKLVAADKNFRLKGGICEVKFTDLVDGAIELFVFDGENTLFLDRIFKTDGAIIRLPSDDVLYEKLRRAQDELYSSLKACEKRISDIEKKINPHQIFKFEQP